MRKKIENKPLIEKIQEGKLNSDIGLILVTWNQKEITLKTLDLLNKQTKKTDIILVDNDSKDNTFEIIKKKYSEITIIKTKQNYGGAGGYYLGQKYAYEKEYKYLILADNDAFPENNTMIEKLYNSCKKKSNEIFMPSHSLLVGNKGFIFHYSIMHRKLIKKIGFVNYHYFFRADDLDYGFRILKTKIKSNILNVKYWHHAGGFIKNSMTNYFISRNELEVFWENGIINYIILMTKTISSYLIYLIVIKDKNISKAIKKGIIDFLFSRITLKRSLEIIPEVKNSIKNFNKKIIFLRKDLSKIKNNSYFANSFNQYFFNEEINENYINYLKNIFSFKKIKYTMTYGSAASLYILTAKKTFFLKNVDYKNEKITFQEYKLPFNLFFGSILITLFLSISFFLTIVLLPIKIISSLIKK